MEHTLFTISAGNPYHGLGGYGGYGVLGVTEVLEALEASEVMEVLEDMVFHAYCLPLTPLLKMLLPKTSTLDYPKTSQDYLKTTKDCLKTTQDCLKTAQNFSRPPDPKLRRLFACVKT